MGPGYVWFLLGWWTNRWWTIDDQFLTKCTIEEVKQAVETSLYIGTECALFGEENVQTVSGIVREQIISSFYLSVFFVLSPKVAEPNTNPSKRLLKLYDIRVFMLTYRYFILIFLN